MKILTRLLGCVCMAAAVNAGAIGWELYQNDSDETPKSTGSLEEGETEGTPECSYVNNLLTIRWITKPDGVNEHTFTCSVIPYGDGDIGDVTVVESWLGNQATHIYDVLKISGWVNQGVQAQNAEVTVPAGATSYIQIEKFAPLRGNNYFPGICVKGSYGETARPAFGGSEIKDTPWKYIKATKKDGGHIDVSGSAHDSYYLKIDTLGVVLFGDETASAEFEIEAANGYNQAKQTATLKVTVSPCVLTVKWNFTPTGSINPNGYAEVSVSGTISSGTLTSDGLRMELAMTKDDMVTFNGQGIDNVFNVFQNWSGGNFFSSELLAEATFNDIAQGGTLGIVTVSVKAMDYYQFTSSSKGNGTVSPKSKAVEKDDTVTFICYEKGGNLELANYKAGEEDTQELTVGGSTNDYYEIHTFNIPISDNTAAYAQFKSRPRITDEEEDDAKDNISGGGGSPSSLPLPSLLGDDQLADLTTLLQSQSKLEPGTWDYALDLYEDEIQNRIDDINDVLASDGLPDDVKTEFETLKSSFPTIGSGTTGSTTTTGTDGTTTTTTTTDGTTTAAEGTDPSDPALGAAAAGGLLFLNQDKGLYKPHWTTERPDTPLDQKLDK